MVWAVFASSMYAYCTRSVSNAGGIFVNRGFEEAVTDGNLVTGPAWTARVAWLRQFLHVLRTTHRQQYGPRKGDGLIRVAGHALETVSEEWMTVTPRRDRHHICWTLWAKLGAKAMKSAIPFWILFIAVQWVDVLWSILVLLGIEKVRIVPGLPLLTRLIFITCLIPTAWWRRSVGQ